MTDPRSAQTGRFSPRIDAGWLLLLSGITLLAAALLIPAADELADARWQRDRTIALERAHLERLDRHRAYLDALAREDPALARALVASQLNLVPEDRAAIDLPAPEPDADLFAALEPAPPVLPGRTGPDSTLARLALGPTSRLWLIAVGALLTLIGLLPEAPRRPGARPYRLPT
ncbi:MAG: hypothetical protein ACIARR_09745 [Phycisphaerales bacterium JB059]